MDLQNLLFEIAATSPLAGVLGIWAWLSRRDIQVKEENLNEKDLHIRKLNGDLLEAYKENTKVTTQVKESIKANTRATETLVQVYRNGHGGK